MTTSTLLTGGAGFDFEDGVATIYLTALLMEGGVLGLGQFTTTQVALQRAASGAPLDDVIVSGIDVNGGAGTLHLQVKSTLQVGDGASNTDFREVIARSWATIWGPGFTQGRDRVGAAVGSIGQSRLKGLQRLHQVALQSGTPIDFWTRFDAVANQETRGIRDACVAVLQQHDSAGATPERLWRFFQHFIVLVFEVQSDEAKDAHYAIERLRSALKPAASTQAADLWRKLLSVAKEVGDAGGSINRVGLLERLAPEFALEASRTSRPDLHRLSALAEAALADIRVDVGGCKVERSAIVEKISEALTRSRFVQITGEPGTGKSAILRTLAETLKREGFIFVLSERRVDGAGWAGFATANGIACLSAAQLLSEVAAASSPTLFIDGIDRIVSRSAQQVVVDILRAIGTAPTCANWRVVASVRDENIEHVRTWIPSEFLAKTGIVSIEVGAFDDADAAQIARALPALAPLINAEGAVREIARRPFFLRVLAEGIVSGQTAGEVAPRSEIELIDVWWERGGYDAARADARRRQQVLRIVAERGVSSFGRRIDAAGIDADATQDLVDDDVLRDVDPGLTLGFAHDVFFEWTLYQTLRTKGGRWLEIIRQAGEPPFFGRVVGLLSQRAFEHDENWISGLEDLEKADARSQWRRAWLIAPFSSPLFSPYTERIEGAFVENPQRLRRLLLGFQAEKTQPNPLVLAGFGDDLSRLARLRMADQLSWPSDYVSWMRFLSWLLPRCSTIPSGLVADVIPVFEAWISAFLNSPTAIPAGMKDSLLRWLTEIELHRHPDDVREILTRDRQSGWGAISDDELKEIEDSLRFQFFLSTKGDPDFQGRYFDHLLVLDRQIPTATTFIVRHASLVAAAMLPKFVDYCLKEFREDLPDEEADRKRGIFEGSSVGTRDWDELSLDRSGAEFYPASPARDPFKTLFALNPAEAVRLTRELCNHAMTAWRQLNQRDRRRGRIPRSFSIHLPWGEQQFWGDAHIYGFYRGFRGSQLLCSALMAMEEWAFSELERGRNSEDLIRTIVEGNECCAVLGIAVGIAVQAATTSDVALALVSSGHLWRWDAARERADFLDPSQNEFGFTHGFGEKKSGKDRALHEALKKSNQRAIRRQGMHTLAMMFVIGRNVELREKAKTAILQLPRELPFEYEEEAQSEAATGYLAAEAEKWAHWADPSHYRLYQTDKPGQVAVAFESPAASQPETTERAKAAEENLSRLALAQWVDKALAAEDLPANISLAHALAFARRVDPDELFEQGPDEPFAEISRAAVIGVAAVTMKHVTAVSGDDIDWAKALLRRGASHPPHARDDSFAGTIIIHHGAVSTAKGLALMVQNGIDERWAKESLLALMLHPLEAVYECVVDSCFSCWSRDPRFAWNSFCLALSLANEQYVLNEWQDRDGARQRRIADRNAKLSQALATLNDGVDQWMDAPLPIDDDGDAASQGHEALGSDSSHPDSRVRKTFRHDLAIRAIQHTPLEVMLSSQEVYARLLPVADTWLAWTIAAHPPERVQGRRVERSTPPYDWTFGFMRWLAYLCSVVPPNLALARYIKPILEIVDDDACFEILDTFVDAFICRQIHDADEVSPGVLQNLRAIANRVAAADWRWDARKVNGNLTRQKHSILKALFFVNVEMAVGARRFANGNWTDIGLVIPCLTDLFGSTAKVTGSLGYFVELGERSIEHYPADALTETMSKFLVAQQDKPAALRSISAPERMATLVQMVAAREHPLSEELRTKLLRLLDLLVELGDRRSAALLGSEWFKTIRRIPGPEIGKH